MKYALPESSTRPAAALNQRHNLPVVRALLSGARGVILRAASKGQPGQLHGNARDFQIGAHASSLAFIGDAVWTAQMRQHFLLPPKHVQMYRQAADQEVTAESQARLFDLLLRWSHQAQTCGQGPQGQEPAHHQPHLAPGTPQPGFVLSPDEVSLLTWASSEQAGGMYRGRFKRSPAAQLVYRKATAFEALLGYLQLSQPDRLASLCTCLKQHM